MDCRECKYFNTCVLDRAQLECKAFKPGPPILTSYQKAQEREDRTRELEAEVKGADARQVERILELEEALGAADEKLKDAVDYHNAAEDTNANDTRELIAFIKKARALIKAAKGV